MGRAAWWAAVLGLACAAWGAQKAGAVKPAAPAVRELNGLDNVKRLLDTAGQRLLVFEMYADWCMPCRVLSPMIERIAAEQGAKASFYKVNIDRNPDVAGGFGTQGIPFVVFVRDKVGLEALTGVHPADTYVRLINRLSAEQSPALDADAPNGELREGVRVIGLTTDMAPGDLYVYRGETVRIIVEKPAIHYSINIPAYNTSAQAAPGKDLEVTFKAEEVGVFPIYCNGDCPAGDGSTYGQVIVMQYKGTKSSSFTELTAVEAAELIAREKPLVLDVRTPKEYYEGHLADATLIPVQQLDGRLAEIAAHKDKPVLVYCRSGNRSTVAAQILARNGFTRIYNLRPGVKGWRDAGRPLVTK